MQGTETISNIEILGVETLDDIIMQEFKGGQDNFDLDDDGTCMELTVERSTPEELRVENSTLSLKSQIEELKQHVYGLEVLNQAMKVQITVQK